MNPINRNEIWCPWPIVQWQSYPATKPKDSQYCIVRGTEDVGNALFKDGEWVDSTIPKEQIIGWRIK